MVEIFNMRGDYPKEELLSEEEIVFIPTLLRSCSENGPDTKNLRYWDLIYSFKFKEEGALDLKL